jgi:eukaryotic-like serine/threonine-protein kinase
VPFDTAKVSNQPSAGRKWQVSTGGGRFPRWRRDGKEIFYLSPSNQLMSAEVQHKGDGVVMRTPQTLFRTAAFSTSFAPYDVTADGKKFIMNTVGEQNTPLTLVVNWTANLRKQ